MKLRYYLRGIGIGVVVTTIIFMISISIHKNDINSQNVPAQNSESKTVAEAQNSTQEVLDEDVAADIEQKEQSITNNSEIEETASNIKDINENIEAEKPKTEITATESDVDTSEEPPQTSEKSEEKVRFEVGRGEYSDVICRKLLQAGLIDDADAFNKFLIQKDYDNFILPGVYDIPKDSTYEEIAVLLTTKVEKETPEIR